MNKQDLTNTKWDARDWSEDMKEGWLHLMFGHGFLFAGQTPFSPSSFHAGFYFICHEGLIRVGGRGDRVPFEESKNKSAFFHQVLDEEGRKLAPPDESLDAKTEQGPSDSDKPRSQPRNKYDREILPGVYVDVYDVLRAYKTHSPALDHAAKKLLASGERGHKDRLTDLQECISSIQAEIDSMGEWL